MIDRVFELSGEKIRLIERNWGHSRGAPVFTVKGRYTSRAWTEWTQGFQFGSGLLQYDATGDRWFLEDAKEKILRCMPNHLTHTGVHDHGFNNVSTYGNLLRLGREGRIDLAPAEQSFYELALRCSGAVQAARWTQIHDGRGYIYSFNGPHSLFADTMRSLRSLALAHQLGHVLLGERDRRISLLERLIHHADVTAGYTVYHGKDRDVFDVRGRVAHEVIFNINDGSFRCPGTQQGYSPFSTWTRALAWVMCGFAEELEYIASVRNEELKPFGGRKKIEETMLGAAGATCDYYIEQACADGIPFHSHPIIFQEKSAGLGDFPLPQDGDEK